MSDGVEYVSPVANVNHHDFSWSNKKFWDRKDRERVKDLRQRESVILSGEKRKKLRSQMCKHFGRWS